MNRIIYPKCLENVAREIASPGDDLYLWKPKDSRYKDIFDQPKELANLFIPGSTVILTAIADPSGFGQWFNLNREMPKQADWKLVILHGDPDWNFFPFSGSYRLLKDFGASAEVLITQSHARMAEYYQRISPLSIESAGGQVKVVEKSEINASSRTDTALQTLLLRNYAGSVLEKSPAAEAFCLDQEGCLIDTNGSKATPEWRGFRVDPGNAVDFPLVSSLIAYTKPDIIVNLNSGFQGSTAFLLDTSVSIGCVVYAFQENSYSELPVKRLILSEKSPRLIVLRGHSQSCESLENHIPTKNLNIFVYCNDMTNPAALDRCLFPLIKEARGFTVAFSRSNPLSETVDKLTALGAKNSRIKSWNSDTSIEKNVFHKPENL